MPLRVSEAPREWARALRYKAAGAEQIAAYRWQGQATEAACRMMARTGRRPLAGMWTWVKSPTCIGRKMGKRIARLRGCACGL